MPNIEIYGKIGKDKEELIRKVLCVLGIWGDKGVVTKISSEVRSCPQANFSNKGIPMPFIRVCSTNPDEIDEIVKALRMAHLGIDTEELVLKGFSTAQEMLC